MSIVALVTWVVTAGFGLFMLSTWVRAGGVRAGAATSGTTGSAVPTAHPAGTRVAPRFVFGRFPLAATGLVLWIIYIASYSDALSWVSFSLLVVVAAGGDVLF